MSELPKDWHLMDAAELAEHTAIKQANPKIESLQSDLQEQRKNVDYWRKKCCDLEDIQKSYFSSNPSEFTKLVEKLKDMEGSRDWHREQVGKLERDIDDFHKKLDHSQECFDQQSRELTALRHQLALEQAKVIAMERVILIARTALYTTTATLPIRIYELNNAITALDSLSVDKEKK